MIRVWTFFAIAVATLAEDSNFGQLFTPSDNPNPECSGIRGELNKGCYDCYLCEDKRLKNFRNSLSTVRLTDRSCHVTTVCCIPQSHFSARFGDTCGVKNHHGLHYIKGQRQKRKNIRSTLQGEYPWRAWLYRKERDESPFCAGTVIEDNVSVIVTSASCATRYRAEALAVSFSRALEESVDVKKVVVHEDYDSSKPLVNNIALLVLDKDAQMAPTWVKPACKGGLPPMHATPCVVMSDADYFIDTIVPLQKKCNTKEPHVSQLCSVIAKDDYTPELGAGLFCQDQLRTGTNHFFASGITLKTHGQVIIYTNVSHFERWLDDKISVEAPF